MPHFNVTYNTQQGYWLGKFQAMASPCEVMIDCDDKALATRATEIAANEALRIEKKFSRYRKDNLIDKINHAKGKSICVDDETANLLDYAHECFILSEGLFDITSGVLRKVWKFDDKSSIPPPKSIKQLLRHVGWGKVKWQKPKLTLEPSMEIDFGGIGKEYAVDRTAVLIATETTHRNILINFGGDLHALGPRSNGKPWEIGLQDPRENSISAAAKIELITGAVTTSGDFHKHLISDGVRYGHILNPITGSPTVNAPRQVTVLGSTCIEAGVLSTLAILHGDEAEVFLDAQDVDYRIIR